GEMILDGLLCDITERKLAEQVLRESAARKSFLLLLNDVLRPLADPIRIQVEAARALGKHLGADRAYYSGPEGEHALSPLTGGADSLGNRRRYCFTDGCMSHSLSADTRIAYEALGIRAFASAPVIKEGALIWPLNVVSSVARQWSPDEIALIKEVAERT